MIGSLIDKFKNSLEKTRQNVTHKIDQVFGYYDEIDEDFFEEIEEILILSDFGFDTTEEVLDSLREKIKEERTNDPKAVRGLLEEILYERIETSNEQKFSLDNLPKVLLIIGINGAGKTTSIGKIANYIKSSGKSVTLAAADTFRAAAIDQLRVWSERADVDFIAQQEGSDPSSVIYDGIQAAKKRGSDILICDTAGRLHNKVNLMKELEKMKKVILREYDEEDVMTLLVLDSTTGQNALNQATLFKEYTNFDGIILTKLDGTSKGGFIFNIKKQLEVPIRFITLGEKIEDIEIFDARAFVQGLFAKEE